MIDTITLASRESVLAMRQTKIVKDTILSFYPKMNINILPLVTKGDTNLKEEIWKMGGKGIFMKELDECLIAEKADLAVHSLKDVPIKIPSELELIALLPRANPHDVLVTSESTSLKQIKSNATIGTSSLRRMTQIKRVRPDITVMPLRGNIVTRLAKLKVDSLDGIILAKAGLDRIGYKENHQNILDLYNHTPTMGQGTIAIVRKKNNIKTDTIVEKINCKNDWFSSKIERTITQLLDGDCRAPIGAITLPINNVWITTVFIGDVSGGRSIIECSEIDPAQDNWQSKCQELFVKIKNKGGLELIAKSKEMVAY